MDFSTGSDRDRVKRDTGGESGLSTGPQSSTQAFVII